MQKKEYVESLKRISFDLSRCGLHAMSQIFSSEISLLEESLPPEVDIDYDEIINHLNVVTGKKFRASGAKVKKVINARVRDGFTVEDFKNVIDKKNAQWGKNPKMSIYLRPETLFGNKFEGYLNELVSKEEEKPWNKN